MTFDAAMGRSTVHLPFAPSSATMARSLLGALLSERGVSDVVMDDALLVVHELVMNGIDHGRPDHLDELAVFWSIDADVLCVGVIDEGVDGVVAAQPFDLERPRGRGLAIVGAISERWRVTRDSRTEVAAWVRLVA